MKTLAILSICSALLTGSALAASPAPSIRTIMLENSTAEAVKSLADSVVELPAGALRQALETELQSLQRLNLGTSTTLPATAEVAHYNVISTCHRMIAAIEDLGTRKPDHHLTPDYTRARRALKKLSWTTRSAVRNLK